MIVKAATANYVKSVTAIVRDDAWNVYNLLFDDYVFWASSYFFFFYGIGFATTDVIFYRNGTKYQYISVMLHSLCKADIFCVHIRAVKINVFLLTGYQVINSCRSRSTYINSIAYGLVDIYILFMWLKGCQSAFLTHWSCFDYTGNIPFLLTANICFWLTTKVW